MKECQAIAPLISINATLETACEFPLAHEPLNLVRLKAEVLADDARVDLNDAIIDFNLGHGRVPIRSEEFDHGGMHVRQSHDATKSGCDPASPSMQAGERAAATRQKAVDAC